MNTREQFGKYLLLKKLTEDPLGETFRSGVLGGNGMERVALLRVMNGQGIDGQRLWGEVKDRAGIQTALRSPNLGEGIEMGEIQGIPYVAYDYISGKNLATLLEQAAAKRNFIPAEHALLITERIALGLASASENRLGGQRILHGFLAPHLVMISNEGETRLLGFEIAPGLRTFAANPVIRQHFGRYLAPEALRGEPPHRADDIYSLGVLLLELLTGKPLPPPAPDGFGSIIDQSVVATEGTPIPAELGDLLKRSLVAREHRLDDVVAWHKTLNKWMFDGQYNPTTFNLAFFMHNLFRQEIERESQELEVEKTLPLPVVQPPPAAAAAPAPAPAATPAAAPVAPPVAAPVSEGTGVHEGTGVREVTGVVEAAPAPPAEKKSKAGLFGLLAAILLLAIGAVGYFWWQGQQQQGAPTGTSTQAAAQPVASLPLEPAEPEEEIPAGPTPEELNDQIRELIGQQASEMEEQLRQQYDQELADLRKQLDVAQRDAEARKQREAEQKAQQEEEARVAEEARLAKIAEEEAAAAAAEEAKKKEEEAVQVAQQAPPPPVAAAPPPPPKPAAPAQVRRGDLVKMGPGVSPPKLVRRPQPRFPVMAKRLNKKEAKVMIRVLIDENGKVVKAELAGKEAGYGFDDEALSSARKSTYTPAKKNGVPVKFWHSLVVDFRDQ
ncbi:MAG: TonB family protein [Acidobacteriota bacterium]